MMQHIHDKDCYQNKTLWYLTQGCNLPTPQGTNHSNATNGEDSNGHAQMIYMSAMMILDVMGVIVHLGCLEGEQDPHGKQ